MLKNFPLGTSMLEILFKLSDEWFDIHMYTNHVSLEMSTR